MSGEEATVKGWALCGDCKGEGLVYAGGPDDPHWLPASYRIPDSQIDEWNKEDGGSGYQMSYDPPVVPCPNCLNHFKAVREAVTAYRRVVKEAVEKYRVGRGEDARDQGSIVLFMVLEIIRLLPIEADQ